MGGDPAALLESGALSGGGGEGQTNLSPEQEELGKFAGVVLADTEEIWHFLEEGDLEEAIRAANAIGDDTLQKQSQGYVVPDAFTHGTSEQRMKWFRRGLQARSLRDGDTFNTRDL